MANVSITTSSSLSRTRSVHAPTAAATTSSTAVGTPKPAQSSSRPGAAGAGTLVPASLPVPTLPGPSNVALFLTNLRLLDLDLLPDWPDISVESFSGRDAVKGQKKRIQAVEWALYQLFALWDPEETRNKLRPFFPPLDQIQSLNLRAALLRCLEQAKKNGVLGRDAVVRKTMLDECKGERLEEVLAVFSSAVLKKVVAEQQMSRGQSPAMAQIISLENRGYLGDRLDLTALILAHRVSLRRNLEDKKAARQRYREFFELLEQKEMAVAKRRQDAEITRHRRHRGHRNAISDAQVHAVSRAVRNNWTGDERWMDTLLYGDTKSHNDGVLSATFDRVWRHVQSDRLTELEDMSSIGLLEQLEARVRDQQKRLLQWQDLRRRLFGKDDSALVNKIPESSSRQKRLDFGFTEHQDLQVGRLNLRRQSAIRPAQVDSQYQAFIDGLKTELTNISSAVAPIPQFFRPVPRPEQTPNKPSRDQVHNVPESEISEISDTEDVPVLTRPSPVRREPVHVSKERAFEPVMRKAKTLFEDDRSHTVDEGQSSSTSSGLRRAATVHSTKRNLSSDVRERSRNRRLSSPANPNLHSPPSSPAKSTHDPIPPLSPDPPPSPEVPASPPQPAGHQTVGLGGTASQSPARKARHRLSLEERTRLSMARRASHANLRVLQDEDADADDGFDPVLDSSDGDNLYQSGTKEKRASIAAVRQQVGNNSNESEPCTYEDLMERTRKSLAGYEEARKKAQQEKRRSLQQQKKEAAAAARRKSRFGGVGEEEEGQSNTSLLLAEELLHEGRDNDYEAVFMSRPKIKNSPVGSPAVGFWE